MRSFFHVLMMLGVVIVASLVYVILADREDAIIAQSVVPGAMRTWEIGRWCLWLIAIIFSVLCVAYLYWLYCQIPSAWKLVVTR